MVSMQKKSGGKLARFSQPTATTEDLKETLSETEGTSNDDVSVIKQIPLTEITCDDKNRIQTKLDPKDPSKIDKEDPYYENKMDFLEGLKELADSIKSIGVEEPIKIYRHGEGYKIAYGERRFMGSILAGKKTIPAILEKSRPKNLREIQAMENLQRSDVLAWERIQAIKDMIDERAQNVKGFKLTKAEDLMPLLHKTRSHCFQYYTLLNAPDDVDQAMKEGKLTSLRRASKVTAIKDPELRKKVLEEIPSESLTDKEFVKAVNNLVTQPAKKKKGKGAGRKRTKIALGTTTDTFVVRKLMSNLSKKHIEDVDWENLDSVQKAWNVFLKDLIAEK